MLRTTSLVAVLAGQAFAASCDSIHTSNRIFESEDGLIAPATRQNSVKRGYATASTDTGHSAEGSDATWALGHPEKIIDYGHRAIHEMTAQAKSIIQSFYGEPPRRSYFSSCSNGGRQALMEAQRYPGDYDDIIAGAPANHFTHLLLGFVWNLQALDKAVIPTSKMAALESAILAQCDARDGLKDGVIDGPTKCKFDPGKMTCSVFESDSGVILSRRITWTDFSFGGSVRA